MSPTVLAPLLSGLLEDFSSIAAPRKVIRRPREGAQPPAQSPAVGRRAVDAYRAQVWIQARADPSSFADVPVLIHGTAQNALAAWKGVRELGAPAGIDVPRGFDQRQAAAGHWNLGLLAEVPRTVPITVGLSLQPGWRDALRLIAARGRAVRFHVSALDGPGSHPMAQAIRAAVTEDCPFAFSAAPWPAVSGAHAASLPGVLNVLAATVAAVRGAGGGAIVRELACPQPAEVLELLAGVDRPTAEKVRALLTGVAVPQPAYTLGALVALGALAGAEPQDAQAPQPDRAA